MGNSAEYETIEIILKKILTRWRAGIEAERTEWQETIDVSTGGFSERTAVTRPGTIKPSIVEEELEGTIILRLGEGRKKGMTQPSGPDGATAGSDMMTTKGKKPPIVEEELEGTIILRPGEGRGRKMVAEPVPDPATMRPGATSIPAVNPSAVEEELEGTIILRPSKIQGRRKDVERR